MLGRVFSVYASAEVECSAVVKHWNLQSYDAKANDLQIAKDFGIRESPDVKCTHAGLMPSTTRIRLQHKITPNDRHWCMLDLTL